MPNIIFSISWRFFAIPTCKQVPLVVLYVTLANQRKSFSRPIDALPMSYVPRAADQWLVDMGQSSLFKCVTSSLRR